VQDFANRSWRSFGSLSGKLLPQWTAGRCSIWRAISADQARELTALKKCHASVDFAAFGSTSQ
jgi:hypothetical protein